VHALAVPPELHRAEDADLGADCGGRSRHRTIM
jgi:hypothetical protein